MYYDLLLHVDADEAGLKIALRNAENYSNAGIEGAYSIAIVVNGPAVDLFRQATCRHTETINRLLAGHTTVYICNNALKERNIAPTELIDGLTIVPAGIVHLVKLQREGFAYVKP